MKDKAVVDRILQSVMAKVADEIGALLGHDLEMAKPENKLISKADYFGQYIEKLIFTKMAVTGDRQGEISMVTSLKGAIILGGTLLMVPPAELENRIKQGEFGEEDIDSFGEIANIAAGVYGAVFAEMYAKKLHFSKKDLELIVPTKVDIDSAVPIPDQDYYLVSAPMKMGGQDLGEMQALFPLDVLGWSPAAPEPVAAAPAPEPPPAQAAAAPAAPAAPAPAAPAAPAPAAPAAPAPAAAAEPPPAMPEPALAAASSLVLVVAEDQATAGVFDEALHGLGLETQIISFKDNVKDFLPAGGVKGVFLVMNDVNDQGVATVIKIKSACGDSTPLVAAGPNWTRKTVLQAVKYGAADIVVTPASPVEIQAKIENHLNLAHS